MDVEPRTYTFKFILIGEARTGKSSIMNKYCNDQFNGKYIVSTSSEFCEKEININNDNAIIELWASGSDCCLLVCDITNKRSFETLEMLMDQFVTEAQINATEFPFAVVVNKVDEEISDYCVEMAEVEKFCKNKKIQMVYQVSAKTGFNLNKLFLDMATKLIENCVSNE
ncbi:GTP-binding protein ypt7, putative [Entamoeba invadens IP1]|uniref:GTP-binding protein ypt7, putative n=1 Tax=Entamoeba invadens IP1 TaxID=370355 RepID=A0A0A1UBR8_ENTIV|nr:GTP-binding protein ypt7, putative [Entamoeba invadens IP1]ELP91127.1 GTP-binding protein ypt7, putative [Entamoeba invadens IP1]|eukprot:XP_004257898.1 GTP-binding protein ypt7, putative [Entamoeba invadens IP1]